MKLIDLAVNPESIPIDVDFVNQVETIYKCKLPDSVKHILSIDSELRFDDKGRMFKLTKDMILDASLAMNTDFLKFNLLPIFDLYDNDYVCYDYTNGVWCQFNIVIDLLFNQNKSLKDLLGS